nr:MAG TPA: intron associated endonuclease [Herelleviridae sp.]
MLPVHINKQSRGKGYIVLKKYIYKITNTINGKIYIGQTNDLNRRIREHKNCGYGTVKNKPLYDAIKKYGIDAFTFEEIEYTENYNEREQYWIDYYDTTNSNNGYNISIVDIPNNHKNELSNDELYRLYDDLKNLDNSYKMLAEKYGFSSEQSIRNINKGIIYHQPSVKYPIRLDRNTLARMKAERIIDLLKNTKMSFEEIADKEKTTSGYVLQINSGSRCKLQGVDYPVRLTLSHFRKPYHSLSKEEVKNIKDDIKYTNMTWEQLSKKYKVNSKVFQHINRGITHHDSNEEYPLRHIKQYDQPVETMEGQSSSTFNI